MSPASILGMTAVVLSILFAWPQAWKSLRTADLAGISSVSTLLVFATSSTWFAYGLIVDDLALTVANAVTVVAVSVTLAALARRHRVGSRQVMSVVPPWLAVTVAAMAFTGVTGVGVVGIALAVSMVVPQAFRVFRHSRIEGVSTATYALLAAVGATWLAYGFVVGDPIIVMPNLFMTPLAAAIAIRTAASRRRIRPDAAVVHSPA